MTANRFRFRAWDTFRKQWVPNDHFMISPKGGIEAFCIYGVGTEGGLILSQSTGLLDKNGKEVFEGDVIRDYRGATGEIIWDLDRSGFYWPPGIDWGELPVPHEMEVIGSIYENPELLGGDKNG